MLDAFVVPEITAEAAGESAPLPLGSGAGKFHVLTLAITRIVEQESLDVSIWGSQDGSEWGAKPLTAFPQKFYDGVYQLLLDLRSQPEVQFIKAKWAVNRWGVGSLTPRFSFMVKIQEQVPAAVNA
jgi:hypothetical protein